jgi:ubiquitin carboxyl-terminal hydrolase L3
VERLACAMHALSIRENWVGLESNPEVLTEYAHKLGVDESWGFTDVVGLDDESLKHVPDPCVGLIFLFPYSQLEAHKRKRGTSRGQPTEGVWYMSQTIGNACGAVALMHTVMNSMDRVSSSSGKLDAFKKDAKSATATQRGKLFGEAIRDLHDAVSAQGQTDAPKPNADLDFHFVSLGARTLVRRRLHTTTAAPHSTRPCAAHRSRGRRHALRARWQQRGADRAGFHTGRGGRLPPCGGGAPAEGVHRAVPRLALLTLGARAQGRQRQIDGLAARRTMREGFSFFAGTWFGSNVEGRLV